VAHLCRSTPRHVDLEHMSEQSFGDVDRNAAKEDEEENEPFELLRKSTKERPLARSVSERGTGDIIDWIWSVYTLVAETRDLLPLKTSTNTIQMFQELM
jgi:hypothetical protein